MLYPKNNIQFKIISISLVILIFSVCNIQTYSQVQPEWKIFNNSNSPLTSNVIYDISVDAFNNKWIATQDGVFKISGDDFTDFSNWTEIPNLPANIDIIQTDQSGNVWMANGFQSSGLIKYDGNSFTTYNTQNSPLPYDLISGIAVDLNNNIWIMDGMKDITPQIYLVEFDGSNNWFQLPGNFGYQTRGDLAGIDSSGNIWTASEFKLTRVNTITHDTVEWSQTGLGQYVTQVKPDFKGNIWIAGAMAGWGGLVKFDGQNFTYINYPAISLAVDDQKNLWVGTENLLQDTLKILKYDGINWTEITSENSSLPDAFRILDLEFDKKGNLWIASSDSGIAVYKAGGLITPVELESFSGESVGNAVYLSWSTSTETNNKGFEIQRSEDGDQKSEWKSIGYVEGKGTTTLTHVYSFKDNNVTPGKYIYRLKQIDFDGSYKYSNEIEVDVNSISEFALEQNYPNPFNPTTQIQYQLPETGNVTIKVYDILGNEVRTLVNDNKPAGSYTVNFNAKGLSSGIYFYKITSGSFIETKKMILMK